MPRLGGGTYKQSYLVSGSASASQTQVIERHTSPPSSSNELVLPTVRASTPPSQVVKPKTRRLNASEPGNGSLLPDYNSKSPKSRIRTLSDMSRSSPEPDSPSEGGGLRRRSTLALDDEAVRKLQRRHSMSSTQSLPLYNNNNTNTRSPPTPPPRPSTVVHVRTKGFTVGHIIQTMVVFVVFYLVYDAHCKVQEAASRLEHYKEEEAMLLDQMERIEDRAVQLQEQLKRMREDHSESFTAPIEQTRAETRGLQNEVYQWKREYVEVNKEVHALQDYMQDGARQELQNRYGSSSVHVNFELAIGDSKSQLTVELFDEAPHASWIFLQQIEAGDWAQSSFIWHPAHMVLASPAKAASVKLEFVEKSYHHHEAWTVGLTPSHNGGYNLYINLQDNSHVHDADVCVGKIVGGYDTLQKLMHHDTVAKHPGGEKSYLDPPIAISNLEIAQVKRSRTRRY